MKPDACDAVPKQLAVPPLATADRWALEPARARAAFGTIELN